MCLNTSKKNRSFHLRSDLISLFSFFFLLFPHLNVFAQFVNQKSYDDSVVASAGDFKVTFKEYKLTYIETLKQPTVFDSKFVRERILDELIANKLLASEAVKNNLIQDDVYEKKVEAYKDKCLREAHFNNVIKPKIKVDDKEVRKIYQYSKEEREVKHLFFRTQSEADSVYHLLQNGASFDSLAKVVFKDSALANSGGNLGWVYWDQLEYDLAMAAFTSTLNQFTAPIKSKYGYHILEVVGFKTDPLLTEYEYGVHRYKSKLLLEYQLADKYAAQYIDTMLGNAKVVVFTNVMKFMKDKLKNILKRKPNQNDNLSEFQLSDPEIKTVHTNLKNEMNEVMATINGKEYLAGDFVKALNYIPYAVTYSDFTTAFNYAVRDFLLTEEAKKLGLESDKLVNIKVDLFKDYYAANELRYKLVDDAKATEEEIKEYYDSHPAQMKSASYNDMHPFLEEQLTKEKKMNTVDEYVKILLKNVKVTKRLDIINNYYDNLYLGRYQKEDSL